MPRVSDAYRERRRRDIAAAAERCVERSGIGQVSMTDIIAESGLSPGAVYGHFSTKEEVLLFAANEVLASHLARLSELGQVIEARAANRPSLTPRTLLGMVLDIISTSDKESVFSVHLMSQSLVDKEIAKVSAAMTEATQNMFAAHLYASARTAGCTHDQATDAVRDLVPVFVTLVQGLLFQRNLDPAADRDILVTRILKLIPDSFT